VSSRNEARRYGKMETDTRRGRETKLYEARLSTHATEHPWRATQKGQTKLIMIENEEGETVDVAWQGMELSGHCSIIYALAACLVQMCTWRRRRTPNSVSVIRKSTRAAIPQEPMSK